MKKKILVKVITLVCCMAMLTGSVLTASCSNQPGSDAYDYPVKPGTDEWKALGSHIHMIETCQIPEDRLKKISTKGLVETVLSYPLLPDMMAFNFPQEGFDSVYANFNGLQELFSRQDAGTELTAKYLSMDPAGIKDDWSDLEKGRYGISFYKIEVILAQKAVLEKLTSAQRVELLKNSLTKYETKQGNTEVYGVLGRDGSMWLMGRTLQAENAPSYIWNKPDYGEYEYFLDKGSFAQNWVYDKILEQAEKYLADK